MTPERLQHLRDDIRDGLLTIGDGIDLLSFISHLQSELDVALAVMQDMKTENDGYRRGLDEGRNEPKPCGSCSKPTTMYFCETCLDELISSV